MILTKCSVYLCIFVSLRHDRHDRHDRRSSKSEKSEKRAKKCIFLETEVSVSDHPNKKNFKFFRVQSLKVGEIRARQFWMPTTDFKNPTRWMKIFFSEMRPEMGRNPRAHFQ